MELKLVYDYSIPFYFDGELMEVSFPRHRKQLFDNRKNITNRILILYNILRFDANIDIALVNMYNSRIDFIDIIKNVVNDNTSIFFIEKNAIISSQENRIDYLKFFIEKKANVKNCMIINQDFDGNIKNSGSIKCLLEYKCCLNKQLFQRIINYTTDKDCELVKYLLDNINTSDNNMVSLNEISFDNLASEFSENNSEIVKLFFDKDIRLEDRCQSALYSKHYQIIKIFLENKSDVNNNQSHFIISPLVNAIIKNKSEIIKLLINNKADVNINTKHNIYNLCPILVGIHENENFLSSSIFELMISKKADINTKIKNKPIFYYAIKYFCNNIRNDNKKNIIDSIKILLKCGAKVNIKKNNNKLSIKKILSECGISSKVIKLLINGI
jgi:hypothetical protein